MTQFLIPTEDADHGNSSVIGVILLVGITVLLSVVVTLFTIGFADQTDAVAPTVKFSGTFDDANNFTLTVDATSGLAEANDFALATDTGERINLGEIDNFRLNPGSSTEFVNKSEADITTQTYDANKTTTLQVIFLGPEEFIYDIYNVTD